MLSPGDVKRCRSGAGPAGKIIDEDRSGYYSDVAAGIEYVAGQGWSVGSLSLDGSSGSTTLRNVGIYATDRGVALGFDSSVDT